MLKSLILMILMMNLSFAGDRFTENDLKLFFEDVKDKVTEFKNGNNGRFDLQIMKPGVHQELQELMNQEKITENEMNLLKAQLEKSGIKTEEQFYTFLKTQLAQINKIPLPRIPEGGICNNWSCDSGLTCVEHPIQQGAGEMKKAGAACDKNAQCASGECLPEVYGSKKKFFR